jgi:hypothetical protein
VCVCVREREEGVELLLMDGRRGGPVVRFKGQVLHVKEEKGCVVASQANLSFLLCQGRGTISSSFSVNILYFDI